jgi:hypothetical protein
MNSRRRVNSNVIRPSVMTEQVSHEEYVATQRRRVAELARQILTGQLDVLDGSSKIVSLRTEIDVALDDDDLLAFVCVESETDRLPIGDEASNWFDEALARKEPELRRAREWAFQTVRQPSENLVARFGDV